MRTPKKRRASTEAAYLERVNRAIDHVVSHLTEPLRLDAVARAASFSPFHFHRVFQATVGETLADYVKRLRLERALFMMAHTRTRRGGAASLTSVALACGFSSSSDFSRCFKQRYGSAPSAFDLASWREAHAAELEAAIPGSPFAAAHTAERLHLTRLSGGEDPDGFKARVRELPARTVAYIRVHDPHGGDAVVKAIERLVAWAERHSLADGQWLGYQWESPEIVPLEQCVYHAAIELPVGPFARKRVGGEIGLFTFPPMVVAQVEVRGTIDLELRAFRWLYRSWLPRSGYVPDDHPRFEAWLGRPFARGLEHLELNVHLPVRRA